MRKPVGLFVAAFATVAGGGLALAVEGTPSVEEPPGLHDPIDETFDVDVDSLHQDEPGDDVEPVAADDTADAADAHASPPEGSHGAAVSAAAHECSHDDPEVTHGECVSAVARDHDGDGVPDHGPGSPGFVPDAEEDELEEADDADDADDEGEGHGRGHGRGHEDDDD